MSIRTPVIGPVVRKVAEDVTDPPGPPSHSGQGRSDFEISISALDPIAHYRFRDPNFNQRIRDVVPGGKKHLLKQIAAATRSDVKTRTTHPGGALFPSVAYDDWSSDGTFYKSSSLSVLNAATACTILVSARLIASPSAHDAYICGVGTEDVDDGGTNQQLILKSRTSDDEAEISRGVDPGLGGLPCGTDVTEVCSDGVNRLYICRFEQGSIYRLTTSKPGHEALIEATESDTNPLDAVNKAILMNARSNTTTGTDTTAEVVVDQMALWDTDIGATAEADLHSKWMDELAGYYPSMMQFDGSTGYYNISNALTTSGNQVFFVAGFSIASFAGTGFKTLSRVAGDSNFVRGELRVYGTDHADYGDKMVLVAQNSAGAVICLLASETLLADGADHMIVASFDSTGGVATFIVDDVDEDDTGNAGRVAPTTGTLDSGTAGDIGVGSTSAAAQLWSGKIGPYGHAEAYLTNYEDFMDGNLPKPIDEKDWTEWGGGTFPMMQFDGSTGYYSKAYTASGNKVTCVARVNRASFSGGGQETIAQALSGGGGQRVRMLARASDHANTDERNDLVVIVQDDNPTDLCRLISTSALCDGEDHTIFFEFDGDAGTAIFEIDEANADDTGATNRVAPSAGTLGASSPTFLIGAAGGPTQFFGGNIGFVGMRDIGGLDPSDFMDGNLPKPIDETGWTEWGSQPLFWNRFGTMTDNKGSAGAMTANGSISGGIPLFWSHTGQMDNNKGSAGDMSENGTITMTEGGSP